MTTYMNGLLFGKISRSKIQVDDNRSLNYLATDEQSKKTRPPNPHYAVTLLILYVIVMVTQFAFVEVSAGLIFDNDLCNKDKDNDLSMTAILTSVAAYVSELLIFVGYPIAGWLADTKYGRYQVISVSLWLMWAGAVTLVLGTVFYPGMCGEGIFFDYSGRFVIIPLSIILMEVSATLFFPNILAFIVDQLIDVPNSKLGSTVRWFTWGIFIGIYLSLLLDIPANFQPVTTYQQLPIISLGLTVLCTIVLIIHFFTGHLYIKTAPNPYTSPYKLVVGVLKFALKHKVPINRSALTYWEEDAPKRIDLGKSKYGGPYTTENVEDVKTFGRIMFFIGALCVYYIAFASMNTQIFPFLQHLQHVDNFRLNEWFVVLLDPTITIICIPILELIILRFFPKFEYILTKFYLWIGLGIAAMIISTASFLIIDIISHVLSNSSEGPVCFLQWTVGSATESLSYGWVAIPAFFWGISDLLVAPSIFCFICSQSPYHMRGMILGLFMLVQQIAYYCGDQIGTIFIVSVKPTIPFSCGVWYWGLQTIISILGLTTFLVAVRFYKNRIREDVDRHVQIIEDIYTQRIERQSTHEDYHIPAIGKKESI